MARIIVKDKSIAVSIRFYFNKIRKYGNMVIIKKLIATVALCAAANALAESSLQAETESQIQAQIQTQTPMQALAMLNQTSSVPPEATNLQQVSTIMFDGNGDLYVLGVGKWTGTSCPNATYVKISQFSTNPNGLSQMLSIAMAAQFANKKVYFVGNCSADPNYFQAYWVMVQ